MRDCLIRGEAPFASHLLYTQDGVFDDTNENERKKGIQAGFAWGSKADLTAVYIDLIDDWGHFEGMVKGVAEAQKVGRPIETRRLPDEVLNGLDPRILDRRRDLGEVERELYCAVESL